MRSLLRYGRNSEVRLEVPDEALVAELAAPLAEAVADPGAAVAAALAAPVDFPPLEQAVVPGDRVVLALGSGVPRAASVVRPIVETLLRRGIDPAMITILRTQEDVHRLAPDPGAELGSAWRDQVSVVVHNPDDRQKLSYLAATADGKPIYLNRALCDADMVIPVSCMQSGPASAAYAAGVYPTFSDQPTRQRYRHPALADGDSEIAERARHEANEVAWLLGIVFALQTVPGSADELLGVVAGNYEAVSRMAAALYDRAWNCRIPHRASLVVAGLQGGESEQTWENLGRAVSAASRAVSDDGAIAILCDVEAEPGPGVRRIADFENPREALRQLRKERPRDMVPAMQLARALTRARVYLLSRLEESLVEELGVAPVDEAADIVRLVRRHPSCIVLANAQHAVPHAELDD